MNISLNKTILLLKEQKVQYLLSYCLFVMLTVFGYVHATKGINMTDEGINLSAPMHLALGDAPFRDEVSTTVHSYDLLTCPIFMVYPDISILQIRCLGLMIYVMSLFILFLFMSRYAPPFLTAMACAVMFLFNNFGGILTPSYNLLSSSFLIISMTLWLLAITSNRKVSSFVFSVLAGASLSLVVITYPPFGLIVCMPLALIIISCFSFEKRKSYLRASIIFVGTFGIIITSLLAIISSYGLLPYLTEGLSEVSKTRSMYTDTFNKLNDIYSQFLAVAPIGLALLGLLSYALCTALIAGKSKKSNLIDGVLAHLIILLIFPLLLAKNADLILFSFVLILSVILLFVSRVYRPKALMDRNWNDVLTIALCWGIITSLIYAMSSSRGMGACIQGAAPLFIVGLTAVYHIVNNYATREGAGDTRNLLWRSVLISACGIFIIVGAGYNYKSVYGEKNVGALTKRFEHPKLKGIYSTPAKVNALEGLLSYLKGKVKPTDYFLAYNSCPLLYFLTHTRPAYPTVYITDYQGTLPKTFQQILFDRMIEYKRIPEYCVRLLTMPNLNPEFNWKIPMKYGRPDEESTLLDSFVNSNYYLEKIIFPFEIWHRGEGPKLRIFDQRAPDFRSNFLDWNGPKTVNMSELSRVASPLVLEKARGDFYFNCIPDEGGNVLRISPAQHGERNIILYDNLRLTKVSEKGQDLLNKTVLINNGSFERGLEGWNRPSDSSRGWPGEPVFTIDSSDDATDGKKSLLLGSENHLLGISKRIQGLKKKQLYCLSVDAKRLAGTSEPSVYLNPVVASATSIKIVPLSNGWKRYIISFVPTDESILVALYCKSHGKNFPRRIEFGYRPKENGFNLELQPGQEVLFIISARASHLEKRFPYYNAVLYIQDKEDTNKTWDRNRVAIYKTSWERYIVSKTIRDVASEVSLGIDWKPQTENDWLEIKDVRVIVNNLHENIAD